MLLFDPNKNKINLPQFEANLINDNWIRLIKINENKQNKQPIFLTIKIFSCLRFFKANFFVKNNKNNL